MVPQRLGHWQGPVSTKAEATTNKARVRKPDRLTGGARDRDGEGYTNLEEFLNRTDPNAE